MRTAISLHRNHLEKVLDSLSVDDMTWAMKYLAEKLSLQLKGKDTKVVADGKAMERAKTEKFLNEVCGKWEDDRDADKMVSDIYESRVNKDYTEPMLCGIVER